VYVCMCVEREYAYVRAGASDTERECRVFKDATCARPSSAKESVRERKCACVHVDREIASERECVCVYMCREREREGARENVFACESDNEIEGRRSTNGTCARPW